MAGKKGTGTKVAGASRSRSARAGLTFPVSRILAKLRSTDTAPRVASAAPVFLAAVLEYLSAEILELSGNAARDHKKMRINPRHLQLAIRSDEELNTLLNNVIVPEGGVLPAINMALIKKPSSQPGSKPAKTPTPASPSKRKSPASSSSSSAPSAKRAKKTAAASKSEAGPTWQFFDNGWHAYSAEANRLVEEAYQGYLSNPGLCDVRAVKSGQWHYQVDFLNFKQTNVDHNNHTVRNIRRLAPPGSGGAILAGEAPPS